METMYEFIERLNEAIKPLYNTKIKDWGKDLHESVRNLTRKLMPKGFDVNIWNIKYKTANDSYAEDTLNREDILEYSIDFTQDGRSATFNKFGKLNRIWFEPVKKDISTYLSITDYLNEMRKVKLNESIASLNKQIIEEEETHTAHIKELNEWLQKQQTILSSLTPELQTT